MTRRYGLSTFRAKRVNIDFKRTYSELTKVRRVLSTLVILMFCLQAVAQVHVKGYYRKDGTYVRPHVRSNPDGNPYNNWSYPGNTNPYTGKTATGNPDTYLKNYYQNGSSQPQVKQDGDNMSSSVGQYTYDTHVDIPTIKYDVDRGRFRVKYFVNVQTLNIRSGPSTSYSVIGRLQYGAALSVIERTDDWALVRVSDYTSGYVYAPYLVRDWQAPAETTSTGAILPEYNSNSYQPYGANRGRLSLWTDCPDDGTLSVYIDGKFMGLIEQYYDHGAPACGDEGVLAITLPQGSYSLRASGNSKTWKGTITIEAGECLVQFLSKGK